MRPVALVVCAALASGCFGYNSGARGWSYAGNALLIAGGGAAIAGDVLTKDAPCTGTGCSTFDPPFGGAMVAGVVLVTAGLAGIVINATRPDVKSSR